MEYPVIDMKRTGERIRAVCAAEGVTVKQIREYMGFASVQSIYDWFHGKTLPSVDNLYALSRLLGIPMESLIRATDNAQEYESVSAGLKGTVRGQELLVADMEIWSCYIEKLYLRCRTYHSRLKTA